MNNGVAAFRAQCKEIANETDQSTEAFYQLGHIVENQMQDAYRIPHDADAETLMSSDEREKHYRGLWYELVQHLADLTYLSEKEFIGFHQHRKHVTDRAAFMDEVIAAVKTYLQEEKDWPQLQLMLPASGAITLFWTEQHLGDIVDRIGQYTAFDGSLRPPADYRIGELSCYGRTMAFRLRTLLPSMVGIHSLTHLDKDGSKYIANLLNQLQGKDDHEQRFFHQLINRVSDGQTLPSRVWELTGNIDELYYAYQNRKIPDEENKSLKNLRLFYTKFSSEAEWEHPHIAKWSKKSRRKSKRFANGVNLTSANSLGIQLLQIKLWQTSFYIGEIDGKWGPYSHNALVSLLEREHEFAKDHRKNERVMSPVEVRSSLLYHQGDRMTYIVNLTRAFKLLEQYSRSESFEKTTIGKADDIDQDLAFYKKVQSESGVSEKVIDRRVLQEQVDDSLYPNVLDKPRRRVAYPRRTFLAGLLHGIKKIGQWLKRVAQKLLGPVFGFVKYMLARIRRGVQLFFTGFKYVGYFLLGKPIVTHTTSTSTQAISLPFVTKFSLDFDAKNFFPRTATAAGIASHSTHLKLMKDSMFYFIDVVIWVIRAIGKLSQPGGWVWLGLQIIKEFKKLIITLLLPPQIA